MVRRRTTDVRRHEAGFSLTELIVVIAMIGIVTVLAGPQFMSYWRTSATSAAATELATALNRARQLAIAGNQPFCAEAFASGVRYKENSSAACDGTNWTGPGTDGQGRVTISNRMIISGGPYVVFSQLGAATRAGTFTVTNPNGGSRNVVVAGSGRVSVQ